MLACGSIPDVRKKQLPRLYLICCIIISVVLFIGSSRGVTLEAAAGLLPGIAVMILGRICGGGIGEADGIMLMLLGLLFGASECLKILLVAFFLAGITAVPLILFLHADRKSRLPFYPFLLAGFLVCRWAG